MMITFYENLLLIEKNYDEIKCNLLNFASFLSIELKSNLL